MFKRLVFLVLISLLLLGCGSKGAEALKVMDEFKAACDAKDKTAVQKTMTDEMWRKIAIGIAFTANKDSSPEEAWETAALNFSKSLKDSDKKEVTVVDENTVRISYPYPEPATKGKFEFVVKNIDGKWKITTIE